MSPDAEGKYRVRKIGCHACAERAKTEDDMREDRSEPGIHLVVERIT